MADHLPPGANPYVGPRTFTRADSERFFGREREARELLSLVISQRLVLFYAQSGAGKSSLLNTRLAPMLEASGFAVLPVARVGGELPPGVAAVDNIYLFNLMVSLDQAGRDPDRLAPVRLADFLARLTSDDGEHYYYDETLQTETSAGAEVTPSPGLPAAGEDYAEFNYVLIVDQFEELFTTHPARWQERAAFFAQLDEAMRSDRRLWVVLTLREDYVAALDPYAPLVTDKLRARYYMQRMEIDAGLDAIRKPAELGGRPFAAGVAEKLADDLCQVRVPGQDATVSGQYVEPVQLQVVCFQLWERLQVAGGKWQVAGEAEDLLTATTPVADLQSSDVQPATPLITSADLVAAGDVNQALEQFYDDTLAAVLAEPALHAAGVTERALREWFDKELITETGIRNTVFRNEKTGKTGTIINVAVDALSKRFLVRSELRSGGAWVELVHDRFVEPIRANNAAWFPLHLSALQRQAALWDEQGRSSGLLLRDAALAEAEVWAAAHPDELALHEQDFLAACQEAQKAAERERRQSRRIRMLAVLAGVVAVVAILAAGSAFFATLRAEEAKHDAEKQTQLAEDRTDIARMLLGVQRDFIAQVDTGGVSVEMLKAQRQRLEQGEEVLASGVAPTVTLPVLVGVPYEDAQTRLDEVCTPKPCLRSQVRWELNNDIASGLVLRSEPPAGGAPLLWGTAVTLTVSQGEPITIETPVRMEFVPVPAGKFSMGSERSIDPLSHPNEMPQHALDLPEFWIGKYEVTNAQYEACVKAEKCETPNYWENGAIPSDKEDHPVVNVSWDDAMAFTAWLSAETSQAFRLPTEAEWEKACRGTTGLIYPWGSRDIGPEYLRYDVSYIYEGTPWGSIPFEYDRLDTAPVGSYSPEGDSPYGAADMAGNVWEWTSSKYDYYPYPYDANDGRENLIDYALRVLRGGSFYGGPSDVRCAVRGDNFSDSRFDLIGFRVGFAPPSASAQ